MRQEPPAEVYVIGHIRPGRSPIEDEDTGTGISPLSVLDADGERALPAFTTQAKAAWGVNVFMSKDEREGAALCLARVGLEHLVRTMRSPALGAPKVDYVGVNMGEGGIYPLVRL